MRREADIMADARATAFVVGLIVGFVLAVYLESQGYMGFGGAATTITITATQPYGCTVNTLLDRDYYRTILSILGNAGKSIYVVMYVVKYDPYESNDPVNILLRILANMSSRGLDVRVVVDDTTYTSYPETIEFLKSSGVAVKLDESGSRTTHAKIVIVDNATAVLGSHNWTESALVSNREASIVTDCPNVVESLLRYFSDIWGRSRSV